MTNELAIGILTGDVLGTSKQTQEAIKTAVKALSQPEIIRCRECRYKYGSNCDNFAGVWVKDDDFCSRAERRKESNESKERP